MGTPQLVDCPPEEDVWDFLADDELPAGYRPQTDMSTLPLAAQQTKEVMLSVGKIIRRGHICFIDAEDFRQLFSRFLWFDQKDLKDFRDFGQRSSFALIHAKNYISWVTWDCMRELYDFGRVDSNQPVRPALGCEFLSFTCSQELFDKLDSKYEIAPSLGVVDDNGKFLCHWDGMDDELILAIPDSFGKLFETIRFVEFMNQIKLCHLLRNTPGRCGKSKLEILAQQAGQMSDAAHHRRATSEQQSLSQYRLMGQARSMSPRQQSPDHLLSPSQTVTNRSRSESFNRGMSAQQHSSIQSMLHDHRCASMHQASFQPQARSMSPRQQSPEQRLAPGQTTMNRSKSESVNREMPAQQYLSSQGMFNDRRFASMHQGPFQPHHQPTQPMFSRSKSESVVQETYDEQEEQYLSQREVHSRNRSRDSYAMQTLVEKKEEDDETTIDGYWAQRC